MLKSISSFVKGDAITVVYNHPHRTDSPVYSGNVENVTDAVVTIRQRTGLYKSFRKFLVKEAHDVAISIDDSMPLKDAVISYGVIDHPVGGLVEGNKFFCLECQPNPRVPVYRVNIGMYSQKCCECHKLIVDGVRGANGDPLSLFDGR